MKFMIRLVVVVAVVIGILLFLQENGKKSVPAAAGTGASGSVQAMPSPAVAVSQPPYAAAATPVAAPAPTRLVPSSSDETSRLQGLVQGSGLVVAGVQRNGDWLLVTVRGRDRNHVAEFLDLAQRAGMRDIDMNHRQYRQYLIQGRQVAEDTYKIRF